VVQKESIIIIIIIIIIINGGPAKMKPRVLKALQQMRATVSSWRRLE